MLLLSVHGTVLAQRDGRIEQLERWADLGDAIELDSASEGEVLTQGPLTGYRVGTRDGLLTFQKDNLFLCAELDRISAPVNRPSAGAWESFKLISPTDLPQLDATAQTPDREMERFAARVEELRAAGQPVRVYFGAGQVPIPGFLNVDIDRNAPDFALQHPEWYFNFPYMGNRVDVPDDCIDFIFDEDLIEHTPQIVQIQYLAETRRMLKPGCWHRVNTPSLLHAMKFNSDFSRGAMGVYTGELRWGHMGLFSHASLKEIAELVGHREVVFNGKGGSVSPHAIPDRRPGADRDAVLGNIYADLLK
ncbi:MAG: class I SAM-dependent methyltransferase [Methylobacteriaceae bacterium]|nr:class I SAM-dependent methyltransferase [Methylobacteriaceae bacterium]